VNRATFETCSRTSPDNGVAPFFDISLHRSQRLALAVVVAGKKSEGRRVKARTSDSLVGLRDHNEAFGLPGVCMKDSVAAVSIVDEGDLENNLMLVAMEVHMVHENSQACRRAVK